MLTYRAKAMTATNCDKPAYRHEFTCRGYAAAVTTVVSPFNLEAQRVGQYGGPKLFNINKMSQACMRSMLYRELCRKLVAGPASESLIAQAISASSTGKLQLTEPNENNNNCHCNHHHNDNSGMCYHVTTCI